MSSILAAIPMPVVLIGHNGHILDLNAPAKTLFGETIRGRHHITALRQPALLDAIEAVMKDGKTNQSRYLGQEVGRHITYQVQCSTVILGANNRGILVCFNDVTDLETAGQMRRDFVANVSHELRTPLTALLGFVETLKGAARDDANARDRFLTIMEREAGRMNRLVKDLLSLSRVESDERLRPTDQVDINAIVKSAALIIRPIAEDGGVTMNINSAEADVTVTGDMDQLQQVFLNLIENAVKYGGKDGTVTITVTRMEHEKNLRAPGVRVDVEDTGDGISEEHLARLTERFYRVDSHRSREMGGTGLGLAIVKHIVNRHRGRLRIHSDVGKGSRFSVVLPLS